MKKKILSATLSLLAALGLFAVVAASPAPAHAAWSDCPNGLFCAWTNDDAAGYMYTYPFSIYRTGCTDLLNDPRYANDDNGWASFENFLGSGYNVAMYQGRWCTGTEITAYNTEWYNQGYYYWGDLVWYGLRYRIASFKFYN